MVASVVASCLWGGVVMRAQVDPDVLRDLARRLLPDDSCSCCDLSVGYICDCCEAANQLFLAAGTVEDLRRAIRVMMGHAGAVHPDIGCRAVIARGKEALEMSREAGS